MSSDILMLGGLIRKGSSGDALQLEATRRRASRSEL